MAEFLQSIAIFLYGIVQGLTEVLPISSSGHLSLANAVLPLPDMTLAISAFLHVGSLAAIIWWFRHDLRLLRERFWASLKIIYNDRLRATKSLSPYQKMPYHMILSLLPTAVIGLLLSDWAETIFEHTLWTPFFLAINGLLLLITARFSRSTRTLDELNARDYLFIGLLQGFAVVPGLSRLGITLCTCLWRKLGWYDSVRLSFLLSVPVISGGAIVQFATTAWPAKTYSVPEIALGTALALLTSLAGIRLLSRTLLEKKSLSSLGIYCCMLGLFSFLYLALGYGR